MPLANNNANNKLSINVANKYKQQNKTTNSVVSEINTPETGSVRTTPASLNVNSTRVKDAVNDPQTPEPVFVNLEKASGSLQFVVASIEIRNKQKLPMLLDTGSEVNLICSRIAESLKLNPRPVRNISVQGITEHDLDCQGYLELPIRLGKSVVNLPFFAINNLPYDSLISVQFLQHIGARLDFSRNVMDYWQNGIYSGPIKLRMEQKLDLSALDNVRARSIQLE